MTVDRLDDSINLERNSLTHKTKIKSQTIMMNAEKGEAKLAMEKCKKFLSAISRSSNLKCKIFLNSWEVNILVKHIEALKNISQTKTR